LYFKGFSRDIIIINQIGSSLKYSYRLMIQGYNASLPRGTRWYLAAGRMYDGWSQFKCLLSFSRLNRLFYYLFDSYQDHGTHVRWPRGPLDDTTPPSSDVSGLGRWCHWLKEAARRALIHLWWILAA
jgi:hypothetical protein